MSDKRTVCIAGASGLVGGECLRLLSDDTTVERIVVLNRRHVADHVQIRGVEQHVVDLMDPESFRQFMTVDQVICTLGTTIKKAGSQQNFRRVDFDMVVSLARVAKESGVRHFLIVTAVGAEATSRIFYNRVKGETEDALQALSFTSLSIFRPSLLLGDRRESRLGEKIGAWLSHIAMPLIPASYRPIEARDVARAIVLVSRQDKPGITILESDQIGKWAKSVAQMS